ncbi:hypothetical protein [Arthrobacter alpinus]|nr:hypothetical protein [Arthrobacter alpinus]
MKTTEGNIDFYAVLMGWPREGEKNVFPAHAPEVVTGAQFLKYLSMTQRSLARGTRLGR